MHRLLREPQRLDRYDDKEVKVALELPWCASIAAGLRDLRQQRPPLGLIEPGPDGMVRTVDEASLVRWRQALAARGWRPAVLALGTMTQSVLSALAEELLRRVQSEQAPQFEEWSRRLRRAAPDPEAPSDPRAALLEAIGTGHRFLWRLVEVLPRVLEREQRASSPAHLERILRGSLELVEMLASCHHAVFAALVDRLHDPRAPRAQSFLLSQHFLILDTEDGPRLALDRACAEDLSLPALGSTIRTGCPAMLGEGPDGQSALATVHEWVCDVAKAVLLDALDGDPAD